MQRLFFQSYRIENSQDAKAQGTHAPANKSLSGSELSLMENILKCYECQKTSSYEEVRIVNRGGKKFWVCAHCGFETPFVEKKAQHAKRVKKT
ncbi:MAG: hypothetical protein ACM3WQ_04115 [Chloroflexota bacterium]